MWSVRGIAKKLSRSFRKAADTTSYEYLKNVFEGVLERLEARESITRDMLIHTKPESIPDKKRQISRMTKDIQAALRAPRVAHDLMRVLDQVEQGDIQGLDARNVEEMQLMHALETALSEEQALEANRIETEGRGLHSRVKAGNDWDSAKEWLESVVAFKRQQGELIRQRLRLDTPYEGLLQIYCPGMREDDFTAHFDRLVPMVKDVMALAQDKQGPQPHVPEMAFDTDRQLPFFQSVLEQMGFDRTRGDLYVTEHDPIEGGTRNDARVVVSPFAADTKSFFKSLKSAVHEGAHGIHLQNLPEEHQYDLLGLHPGMDLWEAVALGYEMVLSRSPEFSAHLSDVLRDEFDAGISGEEIYKMRSFVAPGLDRKTADEVSYHLHVAIRLDLERRLINGELEVKDLPSEWNKLYEDTFGMAPDTHQEGVLQDVHWWVGKFGYFPAYSLGLMEFAHLHEAMAQDIPDFAEDLRDGDFTRITDWYRENVFAKGRTQSTASVLEAAAGKPFSSEALVRHLQSRYLEQAPAQPLQAHASQTRKL